MARNRIYHLAAPCPTCGVGKDKACQEVPGQRKLPRVRKTHKARADAVRAMGNPKVFPRRSTIRSAAPTTAINYIQAANAISVATNQYVTAMTNFTSAVTMTTGAWTVTRDEIWRSWINVNQTTTTGSFHFGYTEQQAEIWNNWQRDYNQVMAAPAAIQVMQEELDRQQRERERRNRQLLAMEQERAGLSRQARERALELFTSLLTAEQQAEWVQDQRVTVRGSDGGLYWIEGHRNTVHGNVVEIDEHGCMLSRLCVAPEMFSPDGPLPTPDGWVGQLLYIRHNEEELRRTANFSSRRACQHPGVPVLGVTAA